MQSTQGSTTNVELLTVKQFCEREPAFKVGGVRWLLFNREKNGLDKSGAVVLLGGRLFIDRPAFLTWAKQTGSKAA